MPLRITTLSENTAALVGLVGEWGLSILVETAESRILLDTGATTSAVHNAEALGINLQGIDCIVLSHGHFDHTGGLRAVLTESGPTEIISHPDAWAAKYVRRDEGEARYAGIPFRREELESRGARFRTVRESVRLGPRVLTTGEIGMVTDYESIDPGLYVKKDQELCPDPLADDLALVVESESGLVVVLGCAHRGIINTLLQVQDMTGKKIHAVLGGGHLFRASPGQIEETVRALRKMRIEKLGLCHCTGHTAAARLAAEWGTSFFANSAGRTLELP